MGCKRKAICAVVATAVLAASPALATFTVDIRADIPVVVPIVGWGLDVWFDDMIQGTVTNVTPGVNWLDLAPEDPDPNDITVGLNLLAISTLPDPNDGVIGNVLLATVEFSGTGDATDLLIGDHNPGGLGDANEGFVLDPPPTGFADLVRSGTYYDDQTPGDLGTFTIGIIPEPATFALLALGGLALLRRR